MIFVLSKYNIDLARAEVEALAGKKGELHENFLVLDAEFDFSRLAYTNKILEFLFHCRRTDLKNKFERFDWNSVYKNNFCIRSNKFEYQKDFAKLVWQSIDNPKVQLNGSDTEIWIYFYRDDAFVGKTVYEREEKFKMRRPDLRPGFFPVSLKPKLAKALVNLSSVKEGKIWDPFCGTSGILIEASLMGLEVVGTDLDEKMIEASKKNFKKYKIEGKLTLGDSRKLKIDCDGIVTDPPYGRRASLHKSEIEKLYKEFLENVYGFVDRVVIMSPSDVNIETKYKKKLVAVEYVHGSLSRKIYVLDR